jgi:hypothetical protein
VHGAGAPWPALWDAGDVRPARAGWLAQLRAAWPVLWRRRQPDAPQHPQQEQPLEQQEQQQHQQQRAALVSSVWIAQGCHGELSHTEDLAHAVDFALCQGTAVLCGREGVVADLRAGFKRGGPDPRLKRRANYVIVRHDDGTYSRYFHLQAHSVAVVVGSRVHAGQLLGRAGNTGFSHGPHLHFDVVDCCANETSVLEVGGTRFESAFATFSARLPAPLRAGLVRADPPTVPLGVPQRDAARLSGRVVLCHRGGASTFADKTRELQRLGAVAVLIADSDRDVLGVLPLLGLAAAGEPALPGDDLRLPVLAVSRDTGRALVALLRQAAAPPQVMLSTSPHFRPVDKPVPWCKPWTLPFLLAPDVLEGLATPPEGRNAPAIVLAQL